MTDRPRFHLSLPTGGSEAYYLRRDPSSPAPDYVCETLGEAMHLQETGHEMARACCELVDRTGRHLLPRHRRATR